MEIGHGGLERRWTMLMSQYNKDITFLIISSIMCALLLSGCVDDSASDLGYYEPYIYARFSNINLSSLSDVLTQNGINHHYNINEVNDDQWDLTYIINKNSSYNISICNVE